MSTGDATNWNLVSTISDMNTLTYTVTGLSPGTTYKFKIVDTDWVGSADSNIITISTPKIQTSISCSVSSSSPTIGDSITVSGSISPAVSGATVTLTYTKPDGTTLTRTVTSISGGSYSYLYQPDATGSWSVKASWDGDSQHLSASSQSASFNVKPQQSSSSYLLYGVGIGGAIIIAIFVVVLKMRQKPPERKGVYIKCPYCRATIPIDSEKCPMCGADLKK